MGMRRFCELDPFQGAQIAVAESARNVVCFGAKPVAVTNCLNFGNPEKPANYVAILSSCGWDRFSMSTYSKPL